MIIFMTSLAPSVIFRWRGIGHHLVDVGQLRASSGGVAISTTEIGTERAMRAAILLGRAGAIRVTSE